MLRGDSTGQGTRGDFKTSLEKARDFHKGGEGESSQGGRPPKEKTPRRFFAAQLFLAYEKRSFAKTGSGRPSGWENGN